MARDIGKHLQQPGDDAEWLRGFLVIIGRDLVIPDQLPPPLAQGVRAIRAVRRRPWEGELPVEQLAATRFPKLVISGNHSPAFEAVCDALTARLQAQRAYVTGAGHATPDTGEAFNETLAPFIGTSPRDHRAISVPLAPVKTGISRSLVDSQPHSSGHMRAPEGSDSQADSAGSIPVTRSKAKTPGQQRPIGRHGASHELSLAVAFSHLAGNADAPRSAVGCDAPSWI